MIIIIYYNLYSRAYIYTISCVYIYVHMCDIYVEPGLCAHLIQFHSPTDRPAPLWEFQSRDPAENLPSGDDDAPEKTPNVP